MYQRLIQEAIQECEIHKYVICRRQSLDRGHSYSNVSRHLIYSLDIWQIRLWNGGSPSKTRSMGAGIEEMTIRDTRLYPRKLIQFGRE